MEVHEAGPVARKEEWKQTVLYPVEREGKINTSHNMPWHSAAMKLY